MKVALKGLDAQGGCREDRTNQSGTAGDDGSETNQWAGFPTRASDAGGFTPPSQGENAAPLLEDVFDPETRVSSGGSTNV